jgi:NAD-dependent DNA ligase
MAEPFSGYVRGELVIAKRDWNGLLAVADRDYANARNMVAGFMNSTTGQPELYKYFKFVAFEMFSASMLSKATQLDMLRHYKFTVPVTYAQNYLYTYADVESMIGQMIAGSEFEIDGVVVDVNDTMYRHFAATESDLNPTYAVKIKLINASVETGVIGIDWNISKDGFLKPVVLIEPVVLSGATISRVTGYNAKFIMDNGIGIGAVVGIIRSGEVIPKIVSVTTSAEVILPPGKWNATNVDLISTSVDGEAEQTAKIMQYFFAKMEIAFIGEGAVAKLIDGNFTDLLSIIKNPDILESVIGENGRKAAFMMKATMKSTTPQRLFAALGLFGRGLGERKLKVVFDRYTVDQVLSGRISVEQYCELPGYEAKSAGLLISNAAAASDVYNEIKSKVKFMKEEIVTLGVGALSGQILAATGVRLLPELIERVQQAGGSYADAYSKSTTILVAKDPKSTSGKAQKARDAGIKVISLAELMEMV